MKSFIKIFIIWAIIITAIYYFFYVINQRDISNSNYWQQRQSDCRSIGNEWDLDGSGACVNFNQI